MKMKISKRRCLFYTNTVAKMKLMKTFNETELPTPTRLAACGDNLVKIVSLK